jgi:N6-adenosine-specific RNA methylase IME4
MHHHHYACIYSDPPWDVHAWQKNKKGEYPKSYYPTMKPAELAAMPVQDLNDPDGTHHFMWVTSSRLDQATELLHSWNYSNVSLVFGWLKTTGQDANGAHILQMGMGAETRYGMEVVLHAYSGKNPPRKDMDDVMQVVPAPVGEHSAKPAEIRQLIVELYPDLPRLEMFARNQWDGWDVFGNQVTKAVPQPAALRSQMLTVVRPERSASWWTTHKKKVFTTKEAARYISDNGDHPVGTHRVIEYIREGRLDARKSGSQWAISKRSVMEFVKEERTSGRPFKGQEPKKRTTK